MTRKELPESARYVRVDTIIECYDVSKECEAVLLNKMPDAYGGKAPGEDDGPEPDHSRDNGYRLRDCWKDLPQYAQDELIAMFEKESVV